MKHDIMHPGRQSPGIYRDQLVRVRTEAEIASTLDSEGKLDGMPFMPEMARYCGQVFRVYRRAEKTCVEGHSLRRLQSTVLLDDLRCDGAFHDGCQRNCLFFWKEAWLEHAQVEAASHEVAPPIKTSACLSDWASHLATHDAERYFCQSTELLGATQNLSPWSLTHFFAEIQAGELTIWEFLQILMITGWDRLRRAFGFKRLGTLSGTEADATRGDLDLKAGEWVTVRPTPEIRRTLDPGGRNRGLSFEPEMLEFTEGRFQVDFPIQKIILEKSGKMISLKNTVALKGVACDGLCTKNCPRNNTLYWREAWLKRIENTENIP